MRSIDFLAPDFLRDPWPTYARLRREGPVHWLPEIGMYAVASYAEVRSCLLSDDFSVTYPFRVSKHVLGETLLDLDGPEHQRLRRLLGRLLTGRAQATAFAEVADGCVPELLDALPHDRPLDFMAEVAERLPLLATCAFLGIPQEEVSRVGRLVHDLLFHLDGSRGSSGLAGQRSEELQALLEQLMTASPPAPPEALLGALGRLVAGGELTIDEALGLATLTLAAGVETSTGLLGNGLHCFVTQKQDAQTLASDGPSRAAFIREVLRWEPPQHDTVRFARRATTLGGERIPAGAALKLLLASANRDETMFGEPEAFDPGANGGTSLSFGHGAHACLGMQLALHVADRTFQQLFNRFPGLEVVDDPPGPIVGSTFRRPEQLHVVLGTPVEPMPDVATRVAELWWAALEHDRPGSPDCSFFELGGYSLLALALTEDLSRELGVDLPRDLIFDRPHLRDLTVAVEALVAGAGEAVEAGRPPAADPAEGEGGTVGSAPGEAPLTHLQQAYWLGETQDFELGGPAVFFEEYECAPLDVEALRVALDKLVAHQSALRTAYPDDERQVAADPTPVPVDWWPDAGRGASEPELEALLRDSRRELVVTPPRLDRGQVIRFRVIDLGDVYRVQVCGRLLVFDGLSGTIFADELRALLQGEKLEPLGYSYFDYRNEHRQLRSTSEHERARRYWLDRLDSLPPAPDLPLRRRARSSSGGAYLLSGTDTHPQKHSEDGSGRLGRRTAALSAGDWAALKATAASHGVTATGALCSAFSEVLRNWSKSESFTLNVMLGERRSFHLDVGRLIGNFSSTLLLECDAGTGGSFGERAVALQHQLHRDMAHGLFTGVEVIRQLNQRAANAHGAAMPVVFASGLEAANDGGIFLERLGWERKYASVQTPQVSFDHQVFESDGELVLHWDTDDSLFEPGVVDVMLGAYVQLLRRLGQDSTWSETPLILTPASQRAVRAEINATDGPLPDQTLDAIVREELLRHPERLAIDAPDGTVTCGELHEAARRVAGSLWRRGHRPGELVGVRVEAGWRQVAALLGVLYAGGAYVPLGCRWPGPRVARIADQAELGHMIASSSSRWLDRVEALTLAEALAGPPLPLADVAASDPQALAYVIFTSGSTGEPKGVAIGHRGAVNTILDVNRRFGVTGEDRALAVSEVTFDLSVFDVFGLLAAGGVVVVPPTIEHADPAILHAHAVRTGVTIWNSVPAYFSLLADYCRDHGTQVPSLRLVMLSGDWVPLDVGSELREVAPHARCVSLGGATEASIWSNWFEVPAEVPGEWASIPYGRPLANQGYRVLDAALRDRPDWVAGRLFIQGLGLADGYLNAPDATAAAFITHPADGERLYATGDWGRYWPDGTLEFLGREDAQVKVNGFRVELSEVEGCLASHPEVAAAVVTYHRGRSGAHLVGHVVFEADAGADVAVVRALAAQHLPAYEVPSRLVAHERLPLTANGKLDRKALSDLAAPPAGSGVPPASAGSPGAGAEVSQVPGEAVAPGAHEELEAVADEWREVLGAVTLSGRSDFFELGGDSLAAARLLSRLERRFGRRPPLSSLYEHRMLSSMAALFQRPAERSPARSLVHLDGDLNDPPVVFVHPVGGDVLSYRDLVSALPTGLCAWGLRSPTILGEGPTGSVGAADPFVAPPGPEIHELAARYLDALTLALPGGPVRLVGWSFGAAVAYEMAQRLVGAAGSRRVASLVLLDPWVGTGQVGTPADMASGFLNDLSSGHVALRPAVVQHPDGADPSTPADALRHAWRLALEQQPELEALGWEQVQRMFSAYRVHSLALAHYRPGPPPPGVTPVVFEASRPFADGRNRHIRPLRSALEQLGVADRLHWEPLEGDHFAVVTATHASRVAAAMAEGAT